MSMLTESRQSRVRPTMVRRVLVPAVALLLVAGGCSEDGAGDSSASTTTGASATTTTASDTTASASSTSGDTTSTTAEPATTLAGEPFDGFVSDGDVLGVMGVAQDDVLNIRAAPGIGQAIVTEAEPTADDLVTSGRARLLPNSIWYEVTVNGETGWASVAFVAFVGGTDDMTAEFLDGRPPIEAETMVDLGLEIANELASDAPPSRVEQSVAPTVGDLGEVTYDVVGIGDDAVAGFRLHIFATPTESGEGFALKSIERTWFCSRGLSGELCV